MEATPTSTPAQDGFRMPGEFEPHDGTWIMWPESGDNWREGARPAQRAFAEVAAAISTSEEVTVGVSERQWPNARGLLPESVRVVELTANQSWVRDLGPTFVADARGGRRGVDWQFNGYGIQPPHHYYSVTRDDSVARKILEYERSVRYRAPIVLEGGSIHVDGEEPASRFARAAVDSFACFDVFGVELEQFVREPEICDTRSSAIRL